MKKYNLNSKADMNRYFRDLKNQIYSHAEQSLLSREYDVECPKCHNLIKIKPGKSFCPICFEDITFDLDIKF